MCCTVSSHLSESTWGHLKHRTLAGRAPLISCFSHSPRAWLKQEVLMCVCVCVCVCVSECCWLTCPVHLHYWLHWFFKESAVSYSCWKIHHKIFQPKLKMSVWIVYNISMHLAFNINYSTYCDSHTIMHQKNYYKKYYYLLLTICMHLILFKS